MTKTEQAVIRAARLLWKYEPVSFEMAGYTKRYDNLVKACRAHAKTLKKGKK